jgi:glutamate synthase domain-containing protein 3
MKRSVVVQLIREAIDSILDSTPPVTEKGPSAVRRIDWEIRSSLRAPGPGENTLVIAAGNFPPEGEDCDAKLLVKAYGLGWKKFVVYGLKGQRFTGCGLGPATEGVRVDVFGSSGDYLASGIDGMEIQVHNNAQDQLCQIMKKGKLVIYGDVGQTFMYGAKGGEVYVLGNAAGRPLINAVGRPRVVINGTCLDFLAESFMAGDPLNGGGFVVLNGVTFDTHGQMKELDNPYPGANLFSLASGGAIYVRDPGAKLIDEQLNGGEFAPLGSDDWELIYPYLKENEKLFGIKIEELLTVDSVKKDPAEVYRKIRTKKTEVVTEDIASLTETVNEPV